MKPFDPKTAKNGDKVCLLKNDGFFIYVGPHPFNKTPLLSLASGDMSILVTECGNTTQIKTDLLYCFPTKRTVWINVYGNDLACYWYDTETIAKDCADTDFKFYIGTYPLEIEE